MESITGFAATVILSMGVRAEEHMHAPLEIADEILRDGVREKCLIFSVDAVPEYIVSELPALFDKVRAHAGKEVRLTTVMPSVTPVCYGAMLSGTTPDKSGVPEYLEPRIENGVAQPALSVTPFTQSLARLGKRVAVVTCDDGCIKSMLWNRDADLYVIGGDDDKKMAEMAAELLEKSDYDLIFVYQLSYDYAQHKHSPRGERAIEALSGIIDSFTRLAALAKTVWADKKYLAVFNCDHGCHETADGGGAHGEDIDEDMKLKYFFGWNK